MAEHKIMEGGREGERERGRGEGGEKDNYIRGKEYKVRIESDGRKR